MIGKYDYNFYKDRITIPQVLTELHYLWDRKKGRGKFIEFVLMDDVNKKELDRLIVSNTTGRNAVAFRRGSGGTLNKKMDLISLVRENLDSFPEAIGRRNEVDGINRVLAKLANVQNDADYHVTDACAVINNTLNPVNNGLVVWDAKEAENIHPFELDRYERVPGDVEKAMRFLSERGISEETATLFKNTFDLTKDLKAAKGFRNLSFPYTFTGVPYNPEQPEQIMGYEVRGFGKYKGKAAGTNSHTACWQAYLGNDKDVFSFPEKIKNVHFAESALDIMAYVQINKNSLDLESTLFVSVGGTPSNEQLKGIIDAYPAAKMILHFDNDIKGIGYDCQMAAIMTGKSFSYAYNKNDENPCINCMYGEQAFTIPLDKFSLAAYKEKCGGRAIREVNLKVEKPPHEYKDWNDVLIDAMMQKKEASKKEANLIRELKKNNIESHSGLKR